MQEIVISDYQRGYFRLLSHYLSLLGHRRKLNTELARLECGSKHKRGPKNEKKGIETRLDDMRNRINSTISEIKKMAKEAEKAGEPIELEKIARERNLSVIEWSILAVLCFEDALLSNGDSVDNRGSHILSYVLEDPTEMLFYRNIFGKSSKIHDLIAKERGRPGNSPLDNTYKLSENAVNRIFGYEAAEVDAEDGDEMDDFMGFRRNRVRPGLLQVKEPHVRLKDVVLPDKKRQELRSWLKCAEKENDKANELGIKTSLVRNTGKSLLLYGPPGTGKTLTAEAVAKELRKPLLIVRYEQIANMWYGNTEKNIVTMFEKTTEEDGVLLFDECDGLFSTRISVNHSIDRLANKERNLLLQKMENYPGVMILTSNNPDGIDQAFERRIGLRLEMPIPDAGERERIWRSMFSKEAALAKDVDFRKLAKKYAFSGGYIRNAVIRALRICTARKRKTISHKVLEEAAEAEHASMWTQNSSRAIGFGKEALSG